MFAGGKAKRLGCLLAIGIALLLELDGVECNALKLKLQKQIIDNIFSSTNYDPRIRPAGANSSSEYNPLDVSVNMYVKKIHRIDPDKMLFGLDITFRQHWIDARLKYSQSHGIPYISLNDDDDLWTPGLFFNDYKSSTHEATTSNILLRIHPDGTVLHSKRYNLLVYCDMDFHDFPFDIQTCNLTIGSYAYKGDEVMLRWTSDVQVSKTSISDILYTLTKFTTEMRTIVVSSGEYPELTMSFEFHRDLAYYAVMVFMPCNMLCIIAYLPFWITMKHFTARVILAVSTCYTLAMHLTAINVEIPKAPYTKALDIFTGIAMTFAFATVVETIIVYVITSKKTSDAVEEIDIQSSRKNANTVRKVQQWVLQHSDNKIDAAAKVIYPALYFLFNVIYWSVYLC